MPSSLILELRYAIFLNVRRVILTIAACTTNYAACSSKTSFQLTTVLGIVKQAATSTVVKDMKPGASPWEAIVDVITHLIEESGKLVHPISEPENVLKSELFMLVLQSRALHRGLR